MPIAEIELDNGLELTPRFRGRDRDAEVPAHLLETLGQRGDQQVLLAIEVPVEAAMRHLQCLHQLSDADTRARLAEPARRGMHDPLLGGNHSFKLGVDVHQVRSTFIDLTDLTGTFTFASAGDFLANTPSRYRQNFQSSSTQKNTYVGVFLQDEWQLHPKLLVSYGLRYERETILHDLNNLGPRFSLAYSLFASGNTVVRFGSGIFFNRPLLRTIDDFTLGQQQLFFDTNLLRDPSASKQMTPDERRAFIAANISFPETLRADSPVVQEFGVLNRNFSRRLDPDLKIPESYQINAGVERDLGHGFSAEANFTFTRGEIGR